MRMGLEPAHLVPIFSIVGAQYPGQKTLVKRQAGQPLPPSQGAHALSLCPGGYK